MERWWRGDFQFRSALGFASPPWSPGALAAGPALQSLHSLLNRSDASAVYLTVCWIERWPRYAWMVRVSVPSSPGRGEARKRIAVVQTKGRGHNGRELCADKPGGQGRGLPVGGGLRAVPSATANNAFVAGRVIKVSLLCVILSGCHGDRRSGHRKEVGGGNHRSRF